MLVALWRRAEIEDVTMEQLALGAPLGDGASGDVFASNFQGADDFNLRF